MEDDRRADHRIWSSRLIAGLFGAILGAAGAWALLLYMVGISEPAFAVSIVFLASTASAVLAATIALAASLPLFRAKPLMVLRRR